VRKNIGARAVLNVGEIDSCTASTKKLRAKLLYEKAARKMLMKLITEMCRELRKIVSPNNPVISFCRKAHIFVTLLHKQLGILSN
jgi:hypothetical protein